VNKNGSLRPGGKVGLEMFFEEAGILLCKGIKIEMD